MDIPITHTTHPKHKFLALFRDKTCSLLENDLQAKWTLLTSSVAQKMSYSLSIQYPSDILLAATQIDNILWSMMERATGLHIPRDEERRGVECVLDVPVRGLQGRSFQHWLARLPVRERGMGLRSMVDIIPTAFIGSLEMSFPFFCGEGSMCNLLKTVVGDMMAAEEGIRWRPCSTPTLAQLLSSLTAGTTCRARPRI